MLSCTGFRRLRGAAALLAAAVMLAACNTASGIGQDVSAGGRAVSNSAEKVKSGL